MPFLLFIRSNEQPWKVAILCFPFITSYNCNVFAEKYHPFYSLFPSVVKNSFTGTRVLMSKMHEPAHTLADLCFYTIRGSAPLTLLKC